MRYRKLGNTGLQASEIGLGAEWLERHDAKETKAVIDRCEEAGVNIVDCWMAEPNVRSNIGAALKGRRERWIIQGHFCSVWKDGQFVRTRDIAAVRDGFEDLLRRLDTDYVDLGMIFYVDSIDEYDRIMGGEVLEYVNEQKRRGRIRHIGMSSHNPHVALKAVQDGVIETLMFSVNPAFDMLPPTDIDSCLGSEVYDAGLKGITPERAELYQACEENGIGLTVMKCFGGGRLLAAETSPFGVPLTPAQCLHYALTRPGVTSVMAGCETPAQVDAAVAYETATEEEKDYASVLASAPYHSYKGECTYCGHCAPCPARIDIAMVNKLFDLASAHDHIPGSVRSHYEDLSAHAGDCVQCGACEKRCPFEVPIRERMAQARALFGE